MTRVRLSRLGLLGKTPAACRSRSGTLRPCRLRSLTIRPIDPEQEGGGPFWMRRFGKDGRLPTLHWHTVSWRTVHWQTVNRVTADSWKSWLISDLRLNGRSKSAQPNVHSLPTRLAGGL